MPSILPERSNLFKSHWSNQWLTEFSYDVAVASAGIHCARRVRSQFVRLPSALEKNYPPLLAKSEPPGRLLYGAFRAVEAGGIRSTWISRNQLAKGTCSVRMESSLSRAFDFSPPASLAKTFARAGFSITGA